MKRKLLFFMMLCCMALSANACGTDGTHQQTAENETANDNGESENDTVESDKGLFGLTQGENGYPPVITLSSGYTMPVLGLGTYSLHGDECINDILSAIKLGYCKFDTATFYGNDVEAYKAMERAVAEGKIRSLGVSNYYIKEMTEFLPKVSIKPVMTQNEIHDWY